MKHDEAVKTAFKHKDKIYEVETVSEDGNIAVHFGDEWYISADKSYKRAKIKGVSITELAYEFFGFEVTA